MHNIAPQIYRQRLLVEGFFETNVDKKFIEEFLLDLAKALDLRTYGDPIVFSPDSGMGSDKNAGFDAFVPLIDSGISAYFWSAERFFSILLYTCKGFEAELAKACIQQALKARGELASMGF